MTECRAELQSLPSPPLCGSSNYIFLSWLVHSEKSESGFSMAGAENFPLGHKGRKADLQQFLIQEYKLCGDELS